jgi:hypothetical protein
MSKRNDVSTLDHRPLADSELDAVSGGFRITNLRGNANTGPVLSSPSAPPLLVHEPIHS